MTRHDSHVAGIDPDGFAAAIMLAIVATAGFFYVSIMPAMVSGLITGLGFSPTVAGRIASCNIYGAALGALGAVLVVRRVPWRRAALLLLLALLALDLASTQVRGAPLLGTLRLVHGLCGGALVGIAYGVMSRTASPDRCFAVLMVVQSSLGGLGRMFLPRLVPQYGAGVLFLAIAAFSVAALVLLPWLPAFARPAPVPASAQASAGGGRPVVAGPDGRDAAVPVAGGILAVALAAVFFFQFGNVSVLAFVIELGKAQHFELKFITATVGAANWVAMLGALLVVAIGVRWGRTGPIVIGTLAALAGNAAYRFAAAPELFVLANATTEIAWFFVIPYLLGLCAEFDRSGRSAALAGLFSKLGLASGPLVAGSLLAAGDHSYGGVVDLAVGSLAVSVLCSLGVVQILKRRGGFRAMAAQG